MSDTVFIEALTFDAIIGIHDHERQDEQAVVLDVEMHCDCGVPAATEAIEDAVNYSEVAQSLQKYVQEQRFELLETLAVRCAERVLQEQPAVLSVVVTARKPAAVSNAQSVGVRVQRRR